MNAVDVLSPAVETTRRPPANKPVVKLADRTPTPKTPASVAPAPMALAPAASARATAHLFFQNMSDLVDADEAAEIFARSPAVVTTASPVRFVIGDPREMALVAMWRARRDGPSMCRLIERYDALIGKEVQRSLRCLRGRMHFADDLKSEARMAFIRAVDAFDPNRGLVSMAPLVRVFIRHSLAAFVYEFDKTFRQSRSSHESRVLRAWSRLNTALEDGAADVDMISYLVAETGEPVALVRDVVSAASSRMTTIGTDVGEADPAAPWRDPCANEFIADVGVQARSFAAGLCERDREIFLNELADTPRSLSDLARAWNVSPARGAQIRKTVMEAARRHFIKVGFDATCVL